MSDLLFLSVKTEIRKSVFIYYKIFFLFGFLTLFKELILGINSIAYLENFGKS